MVLTSKIYGDVEYSENNIITFEKGILGFEELKKYALIKLMDYEPFYLLQSIEDESIGFIVLSPFDFYREYEFDLDENNLKRLKIENEGEVNVFAIVTLDSDPNKITTNLKAPIIINISNNLGEQIVLNRDQYKIKQPLMRE